MKNILLVMGLILTSLQISAQEKRIGLVTFYVDKYVNADKIVESARQQTYELTREDNEQFDLRPILEEFYEKFNSDYVKEFPFQLVDKNTIIEHPGYQNFYGKAGIEDEDNDDSDEENRADRYIAIDDYKVIVSGGNVLRSWRTEANLLERLEDLNLDGIMFVSMYFQWEPKIAIGGMGNAGIRAYISFELFNREAKKVFKLEEHATSKKGVALINGVPVMDYAKLLPMCQDATERLLKDLDKRLPKLTKKVDKKV